MAKQFGLGNPLGLDLPGERGGTIPDKAWKRATLGQAWYPGETPINAIGQGYVLTTPLQLAVMVARLANGGHAVSPHLARDRVEGIHALPRPAPAWPDLGVARQNLALVRRGMFAVCNEPGGTGYAARIKEEGMTMSGKTGSAQVKQITAREREVGLKKAEELPWKDRDHALFVSYAPEAEPRYRLRRHRRARRARRVGGGADCPRRPDRGAEALSAAYGSGHRRTGGADRRAGVASTTADMTDHPDGERG